MAQRSFPWEGVPTGQADWAIMSTAWARDGVIFDGSTTTAGYVTPGSGRQVQVAAHRAWVSGVLCESTAVELFALDAQPSGSARVDAVVWRVDKIAKAATLQLIKGGIVPANTATLVYLQVARVTIAVGAASFAQSAISDTRTWANNGPWIEFPAQIITPGFAVGSGGIARGRYLRNGREVRAEIGVLGGSGTVWGTSGQLFGVNLPPGLPLDAYTALDTNMPVGYWTAYDASASARFGGPVVGGGTQAFLRTQDNPYAQVTSTVPFTWQNGGADKFVAFLDYITSAA